MKRIVMIYLRNLPDANALSFIERRKIHGEFKGRISQFFTLAFRVTKFNFYERSFALWHVLHIPLVYLMVVAVVVHIIAVHLF